jgi:hypothetical protein
MPVPVTRPERDVSAALADLARSHCSVRNFWEDFLCRNEAESVVSLLALRRSLSALAVSAIGILEMTDAL